MYTTDTDTQFGDPELVESYHRYWAKSGSPCHLVPYHNLDVAAAGLELLDRQTGLAPRLSHALGVSQEVVRSLLPLLLAVHDIGKFSSSFQNLDECRLRLRPEPDRVLSYSVRHDHLGCWLWQEFLFRIFTSSEAAGFVKEWSEWEAQEFLDILADPIFGHHGRPLDRGVVNNSSKAHFQNSEDIDAAIAYFEQLLSFPEFQLPQEGPDSFDDLLLTRGTWLTAGWAALADWLGSNENVFERTEKPCDLRDYWSTTRSRAGKVVEMAGVVTPAPAPETGFHTLFRSGWDRTDMQRWADDLALADGPILAIIEDATGSGKTEAALTLAQRINRREGENGVYVALPTMATANGMYSRIAAVYERFFNEPGNSLVLAHGGRRLDDRFRASVAASFRSETSQPPELNEDQPSEAVCAAWFANTTKTALIAPFGVGTIDQAMLAVLPASYQCFRMYGLASKTVIVDEIHAYDEYMNEIIGRLLQFLAASGSSAILLSATLPISTRQKFVDEWCGGLAIEAPTIERTEYPLATVIQNGQDDHSEPIQISDRREVPVSLSHEIDGVIDFVIDHAGHGRCVCWIRNTVDDAIEAYDALRREIGDGAVSLFHARFAVCDRQAIESLVLETYGPGNRSDAARGTVLVATQVVEQSLDLDFDAMVTDLAPIDLILQRAGRMRRHRRAADGKRLNPENENPDAREAIPLLVYSPELSETPSEDWYADTFERARWVYPDTFRLWLTAWLLENERVLQIPGRNRDYVETIYGTEVEVPEGLKQNQQDIEGADSADRATGRFSVLKLDQGYQTMSTNTRWLPDTAVCTRLGEPTTTFRLVRCVGGIPTPWANEEPRFPWPMSEITIRRNKAVCSLPPDELDEAEIARLKESMPDKGKFSEPLFLREVDGVWRGTVEASGRQRQVAYDHQYGLQFINEEN